MPGIRPPGLQGLHVDLDRDDRIREPVEARCGEGIRVRPDDAAERTAESLHDLDGALPPEHQQPRRDAAHQLRDLVERLGFGRRPERMGDPLLDAGHVDDALAQHRLLHVAEFLVGRLDDGRGMRGGVRQDQPDELRIEAVLHFDQRRCDAEQCGIIGREVSVDDPVQRFDLALDPVTQRAEAEHAERVADLAQQLELRQQFLHLRRALAHEDVEHVLDAGEVLTNRGCDGLHEAHARRRQGLACLVQLLVDRQDLVEAERAAYAGHPRTGRGRSCHVEEQIIQELDRRRSGVARLALLVEPPQLAVDLAEQPLQRHVALDAAVLQGLEHRPDDPPQLEQRLAGGGRFELPRDVRQGREVHPELLAAEPAEQRDLETRPEAACQLDDCEVRGLVRRRPRRLVRAQVEEQQRPLGQKRAATDRTQVVQQWQQRERDVATARGDALDVGRQLLHGAHQRVECVAVRLAVGRVRIDVARDQLHLLAEQRAAVDLGEPEHAAHEVHVPREPGERRAVLGPLGERLECSPGFVQFERDFTRHDLQRAVGLFGHGNGRRCGGHDGDGGRPVSRSGR